MLLQARDLSVWEQFPQHCFPQQKESILHFFFFFFLKHRHFQEAKVNGTFSCFLDPYSNLRTCNTTVLTEKTQFKVEKEWPHELPTALC